MSCRGCIYKAPKGSAHQCDYLYHTGHSRGCPIEGCTKRETQGAAWRPVSKRSRKISFDTEKAMELYRAGKCDREIGEAVGVKLHCIQKWRVRQGLPGISKGRPKK